MKVSNIWHISENNSFPFELWRNDKVEIRLHECNHSNYKDVHYPIDEINLVYFEITPDQWIQKKTEVVNFFNSHPAVSTTIIISSSEENPLEDESIGYRFIVLGSPLRPVLLRGLIDRCFLLEYYRQVTIELANGNPGLDQLEGIFELAKRENKNSEETIHALEKLLNYEVGLRGFNRKISDAVKNLNDYRDHEIMELHKRIQANEQLDRLREAELKDALTDKEATEKALQFSRLEEIEMNKIINAHEKLSRYTIEEIKALYKENIELKKRLGIPVEEENL
ncbi:MAG: hypothetical protein H7A25_23825 [Leptospiraceae bacterium]|nr:hypothetical protein [Leptospiraceae bacterium]MCP5502951.1 hypothetical protein [Leptospiraceae bacterium]